MKIYIDCEFDALRIGKKHQQCVISIGAVALKDTSEKQIEFYTLVKPRHFKKLTNIVRRMTQLNDQDILKARPLSTVLRALRVWIKKQQAHHHESFQLYSFGPDDIRTIEMHAKFEEYKIDEDLTVVENLQPLLSKTVRYHGAIIEHALSLDNLKYVYHVDGDVVHNALNDAIDLMLVHQAYEKGVTPDPVRVEEIWKRKELKRIEVLQKQHARMLHILQTTYGHHDQKNYIVDLQKDVVDQLYSLSLMTSQLPMEFQQEHMIFHNRIIPYENIDLQISWNIQKEPSTTIILNIEGEKFSYDFILNYRIASIMNIISSYSSTYIKVENMQKYKGK